MRQEKLAPGESTTNCSVSSKLSRSGKSDEKKRSICNRSRVVSVATIWYTRPAGTRERRDAESVCPRALHLFSPVHRIEDRQVDVVVALYCRDRGQRRNHQKEGAHGEALGPSVYLPPLGGEAVGCTFPTVQQREVRVRQRLYLDISTALEVHV